MTMPDEFKLFCSSFFRGAEEEFSTGDELVQAVVTGLTKEQRAVAGRYLDELLNGQYKDDELERIWHDAGAELRILRREEGDVAGMLNELRKALAS